MWLQNGHPQLAMTAVEEAMKSAHQRGDHASVARALLLLHHVVIGMQTQTNSSEYAAAAAGYRHVQGVSPEEVLQRCLDRCSSLGNVSIVGTCLLNSPFRPSCITPSDTLSPIFSPSQPPSQPPLVHLHTHLLTSSPICSLGMHALAGQAAVLLAHSLSNAPLAWRGGSIEGNVSEW